MGTYEKNMYAPETIFEFCPIMVIIPLLIEFVKKKSRQQLLPRTLLLPLEGFAVGALILGRIGFMGTNQNAVQRAVILVPAVICALLDGALDTLIGMSVHGHFLLLLISALV